MTTVSPQGCSPLDIGELTRYLRNKLSGYMVPSTIMQPHTWPLSPSGKPFRRALPTSRQAPGEQDNSNISDASAMETVMVETWSDLLGVKGIGVH